MWLLKRSTLIIDLFILVNMHWHESWILNSKACLCFNFNDHKCNCCRAEENSSNEGEVIKLCHQNEHFVKLKNLSISTRWAKIITYCQKLFFLWCFLFWCSPLGLPQRPCHHCSKSSHTCSPTGVLDFLFVKKVRNHVVMSKPWQFYFSSVYCLLKLIWPSLKIRFNNHTIKYLTVNISSTKINVTLFFFLK